MDFKTFQTHRPIDPTDPGFSIPGVKMRWISGRVRERSPSSQIWMPLRKDKLPPKLVEHIENCFPNAFSDGNTIRRGSGELILAYAPVDRVSEHRTYLDSLSKEQTSKVRIMPKQEHIGTKDYAKITDYEESASTVPSQFLKNK